MDFDLQGLKQALQEKPDVLDVDQPQGALYCSEAAAFPEFKVHLFETVASTNTVVWDLLQQGAGAGTVAIALTQQAGRGQRGQEWRSDRGGLYLSLGLSPNLPVAQAGGLTLSSAWGIAAALRGCGIPVGIKWLNDLVFAGRKLGGILTETRIFQGGIHQAVIGVGINWQNPVPEMGVNLQTIQAGLPEKSGKSIDSLEMLAAIVLCGLKLGYCYWQQQGIASLVAAYETWLVNRGDEVAIDGEAGTIIGITPTGQLRVQLQRPAQTEICVEPGAICLGYR